MFLFFLFFFLRSFIYENLWCNSLSFRIFWTLIDLILKLLDRDVDLSRTAILSLRNLLTSCIYCHHIFSSLILIIWCLCNSSLSHLWMICSKLVSVISASLKILNWILNLLLLKGLIYNPLCGNSFLIPHQSWFLGHEMRNLYCRLCYSH